MLATHDSVRSNLSAYGADALWLLEDQYRGGIPAY